MINFPSSPTIGEIYQFNNRTWQWNGESWSIVGAALIDQDDMSANLDTRAPTQQSAKAYVDNQTSGEGLTENITAELGSDEWRNSDSSLGFAGSQGQTGWAGSQGFDGFEGPTGIDGFTGSRGFTGSAGIAGIVGSQGNTGSTGFTGSQGTVGFTGSSSAAGFTGSRGFTGSAGPTGVAGFTGSRGFTGSSSSGITGSQGATGFTGSTGISILGSFNQETGPNQTLNVGLYDFFVSDTIPNSLAFTNVPTEARWSWSSVNDVSSDPISDFTYDSSTFSLINEDTQPLDIAFKSDGTRMFMVGLSSTSVYQYTLGTAWDLSTASYDSVSFDVSPQDTIPVAITFRDDGTQMFIAGSAGDSVYAYTLSTAWDLSTASWDSVSFSTGSQDNSPGGLAFRSDGTRMFVSGGFSDTLYQYDLGTAWDLSTAVYNNVSLNVSSQDSNPKVPVFGNSGNRMLILGANTDTIYQYTLSTPWDLSTASYDSENLNVGSQDSGSNGIKFDSTETKIYMVGQFNDSVYQYSLNLPSISLPTSVVNQSNIDFNTIPEAAGSRHIYIKFFTSDSGVTVYLTDLSFA